MRRSARRAISIDRARVIAGVAWIALALTARTAQGASPFGAVPDQRFGFAGSNECVVLGDIDADGDLDVVVGQQIIHNFSGRFGIDVATVNGGRGAALGDLDRDGDLDLVTVSDGGVWGYLNRGDGYYTDPADWYVPGSQTSVALGDIDGDGDLDIVVGGVGQRNWYRNDNGQFNLAWSSQDATADTRAVVLCDVDHDDDLDLVCGNKNLPNELFLNTGGTFASGVPSWTSGSSSTDVAVCDADGDGYLDLVSGTDLRLNQTQSPTFAFFESVPSWVASTSQAVSVWSVALGDIDLDGTIDLVRGGRFGSDELYLAKNGDPWTLDSWTTPPGAVTDVALGDVDNDGDLDLVCSVEGVESELYLNGSNHSDVLGASVPLPFSDGRAAFGDVNGDGYTDIIRANSGAADIVFGHGDWFDSTATPIAPGAVGGYDVAVGDVDGDHRLDVVLGGGTGAAFYHNQSGTLIDAGTLANVGATSLTLGDVDSDNDLDVATLGTSLGLFRFESGVFVKDPLWHPAGTGTGVVAFGDVDADTDLDLVIAEANLPVRVFANRFGVLDSIPWEVDPRPGLNLLTIGDMNLDGRLDIASINELFMPVLDLSSAGGFFNRAPLNIALEPDDMAMGDFDGDADLDFAATGQYYQFPGPRAEIFPNVRGTISTGQVWLDAGLWGGLTAGDADGDGDTDLMLGYTLFLGQRLPVFKHDPVAPTHQLSNNPTVLRHLRAIRDATIDDAAGENELLVKFAAIDVESDPFRVAMDYHFEGDTLWTGPVVVSDRLSSSPSGEEHELRWDFSTIPFDPRPLEVRLNSVELPARVSLIQHTSPVVLKVGLTPPRRPEAVQELTDVPSAATTIGDSLSIPFWVENRGNRNLDIGSMQITPVQPGSLWLDSPRVPISLRPHERVIFEIGFGPRNENADGGTLVLDTNDPVHPQLAVNVTGNGLGLKANTRLVSAADSIPLGESVSLVVTPVPGVRVERGKIYYRSTGDPGFQSVKMTSYGADFFGVIPGDGVTERGLEYFTQMENSGLFGSDPPNAPGELYRRPVRAPTSVLASARPTSGLEYLQDREISVLVSLPRGADFRGGRLYYRRGGEGSYASDSLLAGTPLPYATIAEPFVGERGVEYWVQTQTSTRTLFDPAFEPDLNPRRLQITVSNVEEPTPHPGGVYRMVSFPLAFDESFRGTIADLLIDEKGFGSYDAERWRAWAYVTEKNGYGELDDQTMAKLFRPEPGRAFWLVSKDEHRIDTGPVVGKSTPMFEPYGIRLQPGWTMIGDPFAFAVWWSNIQADRMPANEDTLLAGPYGYEGGHYVKSTRLDPFLGYWVHSDHAGDITLHVPPIEAANRLAVVAAQPEGGWRIAVTAKSGDASDVLELGVARAALRRRDRLDELKPPMSPAHSLSVSAAAESPLGRDLRSDADLQREGGTVWAIDVAKNFKRERAGDEVTISVDVRGVPSGLRAVLFDRTLGREVDLRRENAHTFILGEKPPVSDPDRARFMVIVGNDAYIASSRGLLASAPARTALHQNTPNPFNPTTVIRYDLAAPADVTLRIYDLHGALVKNLETGQKPAGRYEVGWNGENERGERVASGVYFYDFRAGSFRQTKKMVLLK